MPKRRVTLWLDTDDYAELDGLLRRMPGRNTVSGFLREVMHESLPSFRLLVEAAESGDRDVARAFVDGTVGDLFARVGPEVAALRQVLATGPEKGEDP